MVAELGFEPRHTESESAVLPLHNSAIIRGLSKTTRIIYNVFFCLSTVFFIFFKVFSFIPYLFIFLLILDITTYIIVK